MNIKAGPDVIHILALRSQINKLVELVQNIKKTETMRTIHRCPDCGCNPKFNPILLMIEENETWLNKI